MANGEVVNHTRQKTRRPPVSVPARLRHSGGRTTIFLAGLSAVLLGGPVHRVFWWNPIFWDVEIPPEEDTSLSLLYDRVESKPWFEVIREEVLLPQPLLQFVFLS